jgi:hypothetical protein
MFLPGQTSFHVSMFFVTYITFASVVLLNVIIAVLLDEFSVFVAAEAKEASKAALAQQKLTSVHGVLDPLLMSLTSFIDVTDLAFKIDGWFRLLDTDGSGGVSFEELVNHRGCIYCLLEFVRCVMEDGEDENEEGEREEREEGGGGRKRLDLRSKTREAIGGGKERGKKKTLEAIGGQKIESFEQTIYIRE